MKAQSNLQWLKQALLSVCLVLLTAQVQAQETLDSKVVDQWLATTKAVIPMRDVFERISEESEIAQKYSQDEFKAMDRDEQDKLLDQLLKDEGVYDEVYEVLDANDWDNAGSYVRVSERMAQGIQVHMQNMMLKNLPAEQAQMVKEMMGGDVEADPNDVEVISKNWGKISRFIGENIDTSQLPSMGQ